jgi:uncharacterized membrane protein
MTHPGPLPQRPPVSREGPLPQRSALIRQRTLLGALLVGLAAVAVVTSGYLTWVKLAGIIPQCGPVKGCDTVEASPYSAVFGIPVALPGLLMSLVILAAVAAWWWSGDRRLLYVPYALGLLGLFVVVYLTYLELFVIHAICIWCVTFAGAIAGGWVVTLVALRRSPASG